MTTPTPQQLEKYADVLLRVGLNLQAGQRLFIISPIDPQAVPLVRQVTARAYQIGARLVSVLWTDEELVRIRLEHAPRDSFEEYPNWQAAAPLEFVRNGDAMLSIFANNPELLAGQDPALIATLQKTSAERNRELSQLISASAVNWLVGSVAIESWASKVFPGAPADVSINGLWNAILAMCRVNEADPVAAWEAHLADLRARREYMTAKRYSALHFSGPGTDLTVGLPEGHLWQGGSSVSQNGITFTPNLPTEEIFTLPHAQRVNGTLAASKPLIVSGNRIEGIRMTFTDGVVTDFSAEAGAETLQRLLEMDEGARRLGEVALVPHHSPVAQSGLLFYNTLFDENAASHLALGRAYNGCLEGGTAMDEEAFAAAGGNNSLIHVDFMIGSDQMDVDGITASGEREPVMRQGAWAFEV
ncbi:MAG: aminopeptidase [Anaerolineae bacterium]